MSAESSEDAGAGEEQASVRQPEGTQQQAAAPDSPRRHSHEHVCLASLNASNCAPCEFASQVTEHKCAGHGGHPRVTGVARTLPHHCRPCCRPAEAVRTMLRGTTGMSDATVIKRAETTRDTGMSTPAATTATGQPCL